MTYPWPRTSAALFGELTADGERIVLAAQGDDWEVSQIGTLLRHVTQLVKPAVAADGSKPGPVTVPATWAAVTQIAHSFTGNGDASARWVPLPRLRAWILDEITRRTAPPAPLIAEYPPWLKLRPYQAEGAAKIATARKFLLLDEPGPQPVNTPVWTPDGWTELGSLIPGDIVYDSAGRQVPVRAVKYQGQQAVYRITFSDGTSTLATAGHRWHVWAKNDHTGHNGIKGKTGRIMSTGQLLAAGLRYQSGAAKFWLPQQPVMTGSEHGLPLDPYAYGALLGDGSLGTTDHRNGASCLTIACPDNEVLFSVAAAATALGTTWRWNTPSDRCQNLSFHRRGRLREVLAGLGALVHSEGKFVHPVYLRAGPAARRALLAGLLDTDGGVANRGAGIEFSSASALLAADVAWLARSLGAVVTEAKPQAAGYIREDGIKVQCLLKHRLHMRFPANGPNPFTLPRKADAWTRQAARIQRRNPPRTFQAIEPAGIADVCCIQLDEHSTRVYLTDTALIPTHNTGKTITTIAGLLEIEARGGTVFPAVIIVPSWDVAGGWAREIATWAPRWAPPVMWGGPDRDMGRALDRSGILITTYATARLDAKDMGGPLVRLRPVTVICDELHFMKSNTAKQSLAVRRIASRAGNVIELSGTPVTRDTGDLYPAMDAAWHLDFPDRGRFIRRYVRTGRAEYGEKIEGLNQLTEPEFRTVLLGSMRRVAKADVLTQLPPKIYSVRYVDIPDEWRKAYDGMEQDMLAELPDGAELGAPDVRARFGRLSQLACSAANVEVTEEWDDRLQMMRKHYEVTLKAPSWKADVLLEILAERRGHPVVSFTPSRQLAMIAGQAAQDAGYRTGYVTGLGGGVTRKTRQAAIDDLQAGKLDLLSATTGAGGTGITLTAAGTAVFLQRPWLAESIQAEDRCLGAGTPVLTPDGWRPIENIVTGDLVVTDSGEPQPVTDAWSRLAPHGRIMADIGITGQETWTFTADHPFLLKSGQWRDAGDLKPGNWLAMPGNDVTDELTSLPFEGTRMPESFTNAWGNEQRNGRLRHAPDVLGITDDFLHVLGYFAGDGFASTDDGKGRFISFSGNPGTKTAALDRCERWAVSLGLNGSRRQAPGSLSVEQRFYSAEWAHWFKNAFTDGHSGAAHKRLPGFALGLNERQSRVILDGLSTNDGYQRDSRPRCEYSTMSPVLAAHVYQLATRAGYRPSQARGSTGQFIIAFGGEPGPRSAGRVRSVLLRYPGRQERLYDLTVKDAETFVAGGVVVHNCHRIGSEIHEHGVEIIDVIARDTIDDRRRELLREHAGQLGAFVQDMRIVRQLLGGLR